MGHITRQDEREPHSDRGVVGIPRDSLPLSRSVGEAYMDPKSIFNSPVRIAEYELTTSIAQGVQFFQFEIPQVFGALDTFHKTMLSTYAYFKPFQTTFTIDCNATPQHSGIVRLWFDPKNRFNLTDLPPTPGSYQGTQLLMRPNPFTTSGQPHVDMQLCDSEPISLTVPFEHMQNCLSTNSNDPITTMGRINVMVIAPLNATPTSSSVVTFQMWMSFTEIDMAVPIWPHTPLIPSLMKAEIQSAQFVPQMPVAASVPQPMQSAPPPAPQSWWEKGLNLVSGIAGTAFNVATGNWGGAVASGLNTVQGLAMDKPDDPQRAVNNMIYPVGPLGHTQGIGTHVRLDASAYGGQTDNSFSVMDPIEQQLASIAKVPMMFYKFNWSADDAPGTVLMKIPVTPGQCYYDELVGSVLANDGESPIAVTYINKYPTFLYMVSSLFRFWSGSIKYHFQFALSGIHTGKLAVTYIPNNYSPQTQTFAQTTNANTALFDVAGKKDFDFQPEFTTTIARKSWYDWPVIAYPSVDDRYLAGWLEVRVATRLTITNAVASTVPCFVYHSAGDDFFCESLFRDPYIFPSGFTPLTTLNPELVKAEIQSETGAEPANEEQALHEVEVADEQINENSKVLPLQMTNVAVGDVRDCMRRAHFMGMFYIPLTKRPHELVYTGGREIRTSPSKTMFSAVPVVAGDGSNPNFIPGNPNPSQDLCSVISSMFTYWSGAISYTLLPYMIKKQNIHLKAVYYPVFSDDVDRTDNSTQTKTYGQVASMAAHITTLDQQNAIQVTCPFTSNYSQLYCAGDPETEESISGSLLIYATTADITGLPTITIDSTETPILPFELYRSFGDDARLSWLVAPGAEQSVKHS